MGSELTTDVGVAACVVAGGRGSRLGGLRKADLELAGRRLLDVVLGSVARCSPIVVVGEGDLVVPAGVLLTREDPPFAGPAAALGAGMALVGSHTPAPTWVLCLACDQPGAPVVVPALIDAASVAPVDIDALSAATGTDDRTEWLLSIVRCEALQRAIADLGVGGLVDCSMRRLLGGLRMSTVPVPAHMTDDLDTWEDHERWLTTDAPGPT